MAGIVEQVCIVRAVKKIGSNLLVSLEPKKVPCATCDGKCVKMLKPSELIELETNIQVMQDEEVMLFMDKKDLRNMVLRVMGMPLLILLLTVVLGTTLNISEYTLIALIFLMLVAAFIWQVKYLKFNKQIKIRKIDNSKINVEY